MRSNPLLALAAMSAMGMVPSLDNMKSHIAKGLPMCRGCGEYHNWNTNRSRYCDECRARRPRGKGVGRGE